MLSFNGTLIIQLGNFLVSWWVLDRFFFRRCVAQVQNERHELRALEHAVIDQKLEFESIQAQHAESLKKAQHLFARALPASLENFSSRVVTTHVSIAPQVCDVSTQKMLADQAVAILVQRIVHV